MNRAQVGTPHVLQDGSPGALQSTRIPGFDALRGLASLAVVLSHVGAVQYVPWGGRTPTHLQYALWHLGAPAVTLFFVLSGLVISESLRRHPEVPRYLGRRALRLLPVGYLAVLLGFAGRLAAAHAGGEYSVVVTGQMQEPLNSGDWLGAALLGWPTLTANRLNPPLWTLVVEVQVALLMPLLTRMSRVSSVIVPVALLGALGGLWFHPLTFVPLFFLGTLIPHVPRLPARLAVPALIVGLGVLTQQEWTGSNDDLVRYLCAPGAALALLGVRAGAAEGLLTSAALQWLGRVSYSLYATHFPVLLLVSVPLTLAGVPLALAGWLAVPPCLLAAQLAYRWVEAPLLVRLASGSRSGPALS